MTHKKYTRFLSLLLSAVLVLTMIHKWWIPSMADDPDPHDPITESGITYEYADSADRYVAQIVDV